VDFNARNLDFIRENESRHSAPFRLLIGADGAGSAVRRAMASVTRLGITEAPLGHGYRELTIPPGADGDFQLSPEALHIWPRGGYMMIALPNPDCSFTCTLFLARESERPDQPSFAALADDQAMQDFLRREFPDAVDLISDLAQELANRPVGFLGTLYVDQWHLDDQAILIGDAAHAIVPFHGQGMNSALEDVRILVDHFDRFGPSSEALNRFFKARKPNADAIAAMALENYIEMRDQVRDPQFHLMKALAWALESRLGDDFIPRYQMVMFHAEIPYAEAQARGHRQRKLLREFVAGKTDLDQIDLDAACEQARALVAAA
ncbi:MAG: FAD-dependent monooxygenase, partial [Pseudomonadota bacterium]